MQASKFGTVLEWVEKQLQKAIMKDTVNSSQKQLITETRSSIKRLLGEGGIENCDIATQAEYAALVRSLEAADIQISDKSRKIGNELADSSQ